MGLIKAAVGAIGSTLGDQWEDLIQCEDMGQNLLMVKKTTKTGQISKGSRVIVAPGQVAVIYDSGAIVDATAEEGVYNFDSSTSPSFFGGQFGAVFKEMWQRFTYNGTPAKEQAVFYINIKQIMDNKFGTPAPIPFQDWSHAIPNQMTGSINPMSVEVRCFGKYTFQIFDPALFMRKFAGTANEVTKGTLVNQMTSEVVASFQNVLNELGNSVHKVPVLELPSNTDEIKTIMEEKVFDEPIRERGVRLEGFVVESVTLTEESKDKITEYEHNSNSMMQQGRVLDVMEVAAGNANGAATGFMGLGMMNMATGGMSGGVMQNAFAPQQPQQQYDPYANNNAQQPAPAAEAAPAPQAEGKACPECGTVTSGKFCSNCGAKMPEEVKEEEKPAAKHCSNCGAELVGEAKFCVECGTPVAQ